MPFECLYVKVSWKPPGLSGMRMRPTSLIVLTFGTGIGGLREIGVEVPEQDRNRGVGRMLVADALGIGKVLTMTSTYDHRVIQGAESGAFLGTVDRLLQGEGGFYNLIAESLELLLPSQEGTQPRRETRLQEPVAPTRVNDDGTTPRYREFTLRRDGMIFAMDGGLWLHRHLYKGVPMAHLVSTDRERIREGIERWLAMPVMNVPTMVPTASVPEAVREMTAPQR